MKINIFAGKKTPDIKTAFSIIFFVVFSTLLLSLFSAKFSGDAAMQDVMFRGIIHTLAITLLLVAYIVKNFREYAIFIFKAPAKYFIRGLYFYLVFIPVLILVTTFTYHFLNKAGLAPQLQNVILLYLETDSLFFVFLIFFASCIFAPLAEELIYRGIIYKALRDRLSISAAITLSALIFALLHGEVSSLPALFFLGILLAYLFEKYNNLWPSIWLHFFNNFFAHLAIFIIKFTEIIDAGKLQLYN